MTIEINGTTGISGVNGSATTPAIQGDNDPNTGISFGTDEVNIVTGGTTRATVDSSGRLLVGTTTERAGLSVALGSSTIPSAGASTAAAIFGNELDDGSYGVIIGANGSGIGYIQAQRADGFTNTYDIAMQPNGGNVGIGTTAPTGGATKVIDIYGSASSAVNFHNATSGTTSTDGGVVGQYGNALVLYNYEAGAIEFGTNNANRARIDSDGRFNFLSGSAAVMWAASSLAAGTSNYIFLGSYAATSFGGGVACYALYTNGSYQQLSDVNLKKNIETTRDGYLEDLNKFRVVKYNWKDQDDTEPRELGLIAQEVEQIFPGLVSEMGEEGQPSYKGIRTSVLPYMLVKALQEATARIETLETQNAEQATTIASFEARISALEGGN